MVSEQHVQGTKCPVVGCIDPATPAMRGGRDHGRVRDHRGEELRSLRIPS